MFCYPRLSVKIVFFSETFPDESIIVLFDYPKVMQHKVSCQVVGKRINLLPVFNLRVRVLVINTNPAITAFSEPAGTGWFPVKSNEPPALSSLITFMIPIIQFQNWLCFTLSEEGRGRVEMCLPLCSTTIAFALMMTLSVRTLFLYSSPQTHPPSHPPTNPPTHKPTAWEHYDLCLSHSPGTVKSQFFQSGISDIESGK